MQNIIEQGATKIDITFIIEPSETISFRDNIFDIVNRLVSTIQENTIINYELLAITNTYAWDESDNEKLKELLVVKGEKKADYQNIPFEVITYNSFDLKENSNDYAKYYNILCKAAKGDYICIVSPYDYLPHNFSIHLLNKYATIHHSGIVGLSDISMEYNNTSFSVLQDETSERFEVVLLPKDSVINQTCFFSKDVFHIVGAFDENRFLSHSAIKQYCLRANYMGLHNYYLPDLTKTTIFNDTYKPLIQLELGLEDMFAKRNFHIPLLY